MSCDMCKSPHANKYGMGAYCYGCREIIKKRWRDAYAEIQKLPPSKRLHPVLDRGIGGNEDLQLRHERPASEVDSELPTVPGSRSIVHEGEKP